MRSHFVGARRQSAWLHVPASESRAGQILLRCVPEPQVRGCRIMLVVIRLRICPHTASVCLQCAWWHVLAAADLICEVY